jgi:hypothetical protein
MAAQHVVPSENVLVVSAAALVILALPLEAFVTAAQTPYWHIPLALLIAAAMPLSAFTRASFP